MPRRIQVKKETIKRFRAKTADLRRMLEPFESGEASTGDNHVDTTAKFIEQLKHGIAAYEKAIAALEKQVRGTPMVDLSWSR